MMFITCRFFKSLRINIFNSVLTRPLCSPLMCDTLVAPMTWRCLYSSDLNCIEREERGREELGDCENKVCLKI